MPNPPPTMLLLHNVTKCFLSQCQGGSKYLSMAYLASVKTDPSWSLPSSNQPDTDWPPDLKFFAEECSGQNLIVVGPVDVVVDVVIVVVVVIVVIVVVAVDIIKTTDVLFPVPRTALVCRQKHFHNHSQLFIFDKCFISMQWSLSWTNRTRAAQMPVTCLAVWKRITAKYYSYILEL